MVTMVMIRSIHSLHREPEELKEYKVPLVMQEQLVDKDIRDLLVFPDHLLVLHRVVQLIM